MEAQFLDLVQRGLLITALISMPPVLAALLVGLGLAVVQALTQIQEQTAQHALKIVAVFGVLLFAGSWMAGQIYAFTVLIFQEFPTWVR